MSQSSSSSSSRKGEMPRVGETLQEKYLLREKLATGGMGVILKAEDRKLERNVAVKLLHPRLVSDERTVERFKREIDLAKRLTHPNIVQLLDYGRTPHGVLFIVMEYLEGEDLGDVVEREGPLEFHRSSEIILQVLDGLAEAHDADLIHRDLKPSNVFLTKRRRGGEHAKLLDFGVAKSLSDRDSTLTQTGSACGTAMYMPPESLFNQTASKRIDVYAVGLMTLEMLLGTRVFDAGSLPQTLMLHVTEPVRMPAGIAQTPVGDVLETATAKHPKERYPDAEEMLLALNDAVEEVPADFEYDPRETVEVGSTIDRIEFGSPSELDESNVEALEGLDSEQSTDRLPQRSPPETPSPDGRPAGLAEPTDASGSSAPELEAQRDTPEDEATERVDSGEWTSDEWSVGRSKFVTALESLPERLAKLPGRIAGLPVWARAAGGGGALVLVAVVAVLYWDSPSDTHPPSSESGGEQASAATPTPESETPSPNSEGAKSGRSSSNSESSGGVSAKASADASGAPRAPRKLTVRVVSEPRGAAIYRDGDLIGRTPDDFDLAYTKADEIPLTLKRKGYQQTSISVDPTSSQKEYSAELKRKPEATPTDDSEPESPPETPPKQEPDETDSEPEPAPAARGRNESSRSPTPDPESSAGGGSKSTEPEPAGSNAFEDIADDYTID